LSAPQQGSLFAFDEFQILECISGISAEDIKEIVKETLMYSGSLNTLKYLLRFLLYIQR
jgi:hypothetical protein